MTYRNKPINEWFAKEWVEQDVKALQESFQYKLEQIQEQKGDDLTLFDRDLNINFNAPMKEIKPQLLAALKPIFNQTMTSADGKVKAYMSLKSLSKMTSDKAIQKSVDNGFSREQHLQAVLDIERLFENSKLQATEPHKSGETNAIIHRLNSELANGNALITTKESLDINKNRVYSLELELIPRFSDSSTPLNTRISEGGFNSQKGHQEQTIKAEPSIAKTDEQIIAQQKIKFAMQKFNYDEKKAKDLLEWHKDSSPLTKDENGLPKVFYHGSETDKPFEVFLSEKDQTKWGFWFSSNADDADLYAMARDNQAGKHVYEVFLKAKNIFDFNDEKNLEVLKKIFSKEDYEFMLDDLQKWGKEINVFNMLRDTNFDTYGSKAEVFKNELKKLGYDGIKELGDTIVVFDSNQIKHIDNKGVDGKYFNESSPNIYQSNAHLGSGLVGGSVAGIESDENGNLTFSPEKFVLGLLGGAAGSKAVTQGFKYLKENPQVKEAVVKELADTLALGFDKARQKYPLLSLLEPRYIVQNERGRKIQAKSMLKEAQEKALKQEREAIEKVLSGSTQKAEILKDLDNADEILAVILKGYQKGQKGKGAEHIRLEHTLDTTQEGYLTQNEVLNMGVKMREFIEKYGEPFIETNDKGMKSRIYEWEKNNTRFRIVAGIRAKEGNIAPFPLADEIITFYSDRNLKEKMNFKNPALKETIIDVKKMQKAREKEHFYSTFSLQDVLDNTFIKLNNIEDRYYGSIQIDPKLKEGEYHISSNQLYLNKADFNKNKISDEAIRDFLKSLRLLENNNNELWEAQNIAYKHNIPLSRAKKVMQEQKQYQKEIPLFKEAREHFKEFEPRKIKDLLEWHKDSSPLTKDEQGLPRVFYHGSTSGKKIIEFDREFDKSGWGFWFSPIRAVSAGFAKHSKPQPVFLKLEKPFDMTKGVDFDLMLKEELFFGKEQIEELKPEFKKIQKIYKGLLQDLDKQGIKPIEFFHDGSFYGIRNNKLGFFNTEAGEMGGLKGAGLTHKIQAIPLTQNYKAFKEWQDKHNITGGIRNEYDLLFRLTKQ